MKELLSGRGALKLRTTEDGKAAKVVSSLTWVSEVKAEAGGLVVMAPAERSSEILAALSVQGIHITEMSQVHDSLEEFYLEVTGESNASTEEETS